MENAGNIFYGERAITGRGNAGPLIAHEIAHQWFGDAVTVDDWHHVWLSEGFATYFTHLYHEHAFGRERLADGLQRDRQRVIGYAQRNPDQPIIDPRIPVERILSANVYQKAGWVLHMLRREIGDEAFHTAIRRFFERYRHDNAVTADFQAVVEEVAGRDLDVFFEQWFHKPGVPEFEGEWTYDADARQVIVTMRQVRAVGTIYDLPLDIGIIRPEDSFSRAETVRINAAEHRFTFECTRAPDDVVLDPDTWLLFEAQFGRK
jgi:aminopeptidase N